MSSDRKIIADTLENEETRVAILEGGRLSEIFIERMWDHQKAGEIYKARVESVLPGINAAFVCIGDGRNAFLIRGSTDPGKEYLWQSLHRQYYRLILMNY